MDGIAVPAAALTLPYLVAFQAQGLRANDRAPVTLWRLAFVLKTSAIVGQPGRCLILQIPAHAPARDLANILRSAAADLDNMAVGQDLAANDQTETPSAGIIAA